MFPRCRDIDADGRLDLFVPDVQVGRDRFGREALRAYIEPALQLSEQNASAPDNLSHCPGNASGGYRYDENIKNLFRVRTVPSDTQMRTILDPLEPDRDLGVAAATRLEAADDAGGRHRPRTASDHHGRTDLRNGRVSEASLHEIPYRIR